MTKLIKLLVLCALLFVNSCRNEPPKLDKSDESNKDGQATFKAQETDNYKESDSFNDEWYSRTKVSQKMLELINSDNTKVLREYNDIWKRHSLTLDVTINKTQTDTWEIEYFQESNKLTEVTIRVESNFKSNEPATSVLVSDKNFDGFPESVTAKGELAKVHEGPYRQIFEKSDKPMLLWYRDSTDLLDEDLTRYSMYLTKAHIRKFLELSLK